MTLTTRAMIGLHARMMNRALLRIGNENTNAKVTRPSAETMRIPLQASATAT